MGTTVNEILEKFDSLSIEDQESILEIEKKRLIQRKREILIDEVNQAQKEIQEGKYITGDTDTLMKAIEDEGKTDKFGNFNKPYNLLFRLKNLLIHFFS